MAIEFVPIHDDFGAEVRGLDLTRPLGEASLADLMAGFNRHALLLFRGQPLEPGHEVALARCFPNDGGLSPYRTYLLDGYPEITLLGNIDPPDGRSEAYLNKIGIEWHTDGTSCRHPMIATLLYAAEAPERGGETLFTSGYTAWEVQPDEVKERARKLRVRYNFKRLLEKQSAANGIPVDELRKKWRGRFEPILHPLVLTHPVTGREALWVTWAEMDHIEGLDVEESRALVMDLLERATRPELVYSHQWRPHDLVVWDNRCTLHTTTPYTYESGRRLLHRIGLFGNETYALA